MPGRSGRALLSRTPSGRTRGALALLPTTLADSASRQRGRPRTSSFHVVGTIFDRVWIEGNPDNQFRGMQTVLLGSSNSAIVEFVIPEEGSYIMVDHHFANASQGAIGLIAAGGKPDEHAAPEH